MKNALIMLLILM